MKFRLTALWLLLSVATFAQIDFRKETIYFLLTTRFFDGDTTNNRATEWCSWYPGNPNNANFSGPEDVTWRGDFRGLIQKLDYIKDMGFTAIWITPIVQQRGPLEYHGYHAWDFTKVDPRLESPGATFKDLVDAAHAKGMKVVLDIVTNHSGRFGIKGQSELKYNTDTTKSWGKKLDGTGLTDNPNWEYDGMTPNPDDGKLWSRANLAKMPAPYNQNLAAWNWPSTESFVATSDPSWYHQSGNGFAQGWDDTTNLYLRALADDCPDLNTESKVVQDYLFNAYKQYIDAGVDAFRWDTWKHMGKQDIFALYDRFKAYKPDLFVFGEVAQKRHELHPVQEINPHWYTWRGGVGSSAPAGVGVLDFYAESTFHGVFQEGGGFGGVTAAARYDNLYSDPSLLVTWLDNHDFGPNNDWNQRYGGSDENLAACMNFMFTWRGIPSVYYGTEMRFKSGAFNDLHNGGGTQRSINETGRAYYGDMMSQAPNHKIYQHIKKLNAIRKAVPALQNGNWQWAGNAPYNGVGYTRQSGSSFVCVGLAKDGDAAFSFSGIQNGVYRDAVTGREINVSNGTLQFSVKSCSAGIYVLNGPGMIGESGAGFFEACVTGCTLPVKLAISPVGDNYNAPVNVTMSASGGSGAITIRYTTDGSEPSASSPVYNGSFGVNTTTTVRAVAFDAGGRKSELQAQRYTFVLPPPVLAITPAGGNYFNPVNVTMTASGGTAPYNIRYTINGDEPTVASTQYTAPFAINTATTVKGKVFDANGTPSATVSRSYTFNIPPPVVAATPAAGNFSAGSVNVTLSATSPRPPVTVYYTTDGSTPTTLSSVYSAPIALIGGDPDTLKYFGVDNEGRQSTVIQSVYTFYPIPDFYVYFKRPVNWTTNVRIHYFSAQPSGSLANTTWPGVAMEKVCGDWYRYKFSGVTSVGIVFNDGAGRQTPDLSATKTAYYDNGWLANAPNITAPIPQFSANPGLTGTAPFTVEFNGSLSTACNGIQNYAWDFGNGESGAGQNPSTTYTQPGTYAVKLTVTDYTGQQASVTQQVQVADASAGFWVYFKKPTAWGNTVKINFYNRMPGNTGNAFPGADMTQHCGPLYKYFFGNTVAVNFVISDGTTTNKTSELNANSNTTFVGSRKVLGAPNLEQTLYANFEISPVTGVPPLSASFTAEAAIGCANIVNYSWSFGNGLSGSGATPGTSYNTAGVYPVKLTVTDANGQSHSLTKKIVVGQAEGNVKLHFRRPAGWTNVPRTYFWNPAPAVTTTGWPGQQMTDEGNGWYGFTITGANCANVIFNNNSSPQTADLLNVCGEQWFDNGWLSQIVPDNPLPVRLLQFGAARQGNDVLVNWTTSEESGVRMYTVERSTNGRLFDAIGSVPARNMNGRSSYRFVDSKLPAAGAVYYRLLGVDNDGKNFYSAVSVVNLDSEAGAWQVYPNPALKQLFVQVPATAGSLVELKLTDAGGRTVWRRRQNGGSLVSIERQATWAPGIYLLEAVSADGKALMRTKVVLQ